MAENTNPFKSAHAGNCGLSLVASFWLLVADSWSGGKAATTAPLVGLAGSASLRVPPIQRSDPSTCARGRLSPRPYQPKRLPNHIQLLPRLHRPASNQQPATIRNPLPLPLSPSRLPQLNPIPLR